MKTRTWAALLALILTACAGLSVMLLIPKEAASFAEIRSEGRLYKTVDLAVDQEFQVVTDRGSNTVTVKDGRIAVTSATCPDHYCMNRGYCHSGTDIVCLPNQLVIHFTDVQEIDAVIG